MKPPEPLYPCHFCNEEYSWPASDLSWSLRFNNWVCGECWCDNCYDDEYEPDERGVRLSDYLTQTEDKELATLRAKANAYDEGQEAWGVYNGKDEFIWSDSSLSLREKAGLPIGFTCRKVRIVEEIEKGTE